MYQKTAVRWQSEYTPASTGGRCQSAGILEQQSSKQAERKQHAEWKRALRVAEHRTQCSRATEILTENRTAGLGLFGEHGGKDALEDGRELLFGSIHEEAFNMVHGAKAPHQDTRW